jgi:hypothetical protein
VSWVSETEGGGVPVPVVAGVMHNRGCLISVPRETGMTSNTDPLGQCCAAERLAYLQTSFLLKYSLIVPAKQINQANVTERETGSGRHLRGTTGISSHTDAFTSLTSTVQQGNRTLSMAAWRLFTARIERAEPVRLRCSNRQNRCLPACLRRRISRAAGQEIPSPGKVYVSTSIRNRSAEAS